MADVENPEKRLDDLERQVKNLTDQLDVMRQMASYGPAIDSGSAELTADLWLEDGIYDVDVGNKNGRDELIAMVETMPHKGYLERGCGHVIGLPRVTVSNDVAIATCYARLYLRGENGFIVHRVSANRWEFVRTATGWKISKRTNRLLDGTDESKALFRRCFDD